MKIHGAAPGQVLDVDTAGVADRVQAWRREGLGEEDALVPLQQRARGGVQVSRLPVGAARRSVRIVEPVAPRGRRHRGHGHPAVGRAAGPGIDNTSAATCAQRVSGGGQMRICAASDATTG
jgi:hypothetical protein